MKLTARSLMRLIGVHPALVKVVMQAVTNSPLDFQVSEGLRTLERQKQLLAAGKSQTLNSRHLTGHAVDLVVLNLDGSANWELPKYAKLAEHMKAAAALCNTALVCGVEWKMRDGPHFQLPFATYPK